MISDVLPTKNDKVLPDVFFPRQTPTLHENHENQAIMKANSAPIGVITEAPLPMSPPTKSCGMAISLGTPVFGTGASVRFLLQNKLSNKNHEHEILLG